MTHRVIKSITTAAGRFEPGREVVLDEAQAAKLERLGCVERIEAPKPKPRRRPKSEG